MMTGITDADFVAIITALGAVVGAMIAGGTTLFVHHSRRTTSLEERLNDLAERDRLWWLYTRRLADHIYRRRKPPPPEPPPGLFLDDDN